MVAFDHGWRISEIAVGVLSFSSAAIPPSFPSFFFLSRNTSPSELYHWGVFYENAITGDRLM